MATLRYGDLVGKSNGVLDMTSLTNEEFEILLPHFERAFQAHMAEWRLDGKRRTVRRYTTYSNCPLPTAEDRLLFILVYLKTNPLQIAHGLMFGLPQGKTNQWLHLLLPLLRNALREMGDAPSRTLSELAERLALPSEQIEPQSTPLFVTMEPNDQSSVPRMLLNRKAAIAARRKVIE